jgi:predicted membrane channel-forming protein YqfA (hemolysin III family)
LGFLCVSKVFSQGKLERWIRWLFIATGISGLVVFTDSLFKLPTVLTLIDLSIAGIVLTIGPILLAVLYRRK